MEAGSHQERRLAYVSVPGTIGSTADRQEGRCRNHLVCRGESRLQGRFSCTQKSPRAFVSDTCEGRREHAGIRFRAILHNAIGPNQATDSFPVWLPSHSSKVSTAGLLRTLPYSFSGTPPDQPTRHPLLRIRTADSPLGVIGGYGSTASNKSDLQIPVSSWFPLE